MAKRASCRVHRVSMIAFGDSWRSTERGAGGRSAANRSVVGLTRRAAFGNRPALQHRFGFIREVASIPVGRRFDGPRAAVLAHVDLRFRRPSLASSDKKAPARQRSRSCCVCTIHGPGDEVDGSTSGVDLASWRSRVAAVFQDYAPRVALRDKRGAGRARITSCAPRRERGSGSSPTDTVLRADTRRYGLSECNGQRIAIERSWPAVTLGAGCAPRRATAQRRPR